MRDYTWYAMFKSSLPIKLNCFFGLLCSPDPSAIKNMRYMLAERLARDTPPVTTRSEICGSLMDYCTSRIHRKPL
ncbi:hypothetical protein TNCV_2045731 [Trichonephila clavipes]|uniref:Uncharacterized protein n=1 Tax=Trichonephila clavipes TaxID=2585209 RepID=A0A8X6SQN2_TRICX|nr:hypothetical protein TNCV_2045731 [Trichonephila clavipes]